MPAPLSSDRLLQTLKLRTLRVFDQVVEHGSTIRAAQVLNLTQPAVTKSIQELEETLGIELFVRTNRGLIPTDYAQVLERRVKSLLAEFRYLADESNAFLAGDSGHVIVGTLISASARLLPLAITLLHDMAPRIGLTVREGTNDQLYPALAVGEIDLIVGRLPESTYSWLRDGLVKCDLLLHESLCVVVGAQHPLAQRAGVGLCLADTLPYGWIFPLAVSPTRAVVEQMFAQAGLPLPARVIESLSLLTNLGLLLGSETIGVLPGAAAREFARRGLLHVLPLSNRLSFGEVGFSVRTSHPLTPAAQRFLGCLRDAAACIEREDGPPIQP
jgi:DNA-binding transcriptional LysR family regulator